MSGDDVTVKVGGDTADAEGKVKSLGERFKELQEQLEEFGKKAEDVGKKIEHAIDFEVLKEGLNKVREASDECVAAFARSEQAGFALDVTLKNQGIGTEELKEKYHELAQAIAEKSKFTVDEVTEGEARLQSYLGQTEVTKGLLVATANFAAYLKTDFNTAAQLIAKTIGGDSVNALARYGIEVTKGASTSQKMQEVIDGLQGRFKGLAAAQIQGLGILGQTSKAFDELQKAIGKELAPKIKEIAAFMKDLFDAAAKNETLVTVAAYGLIAAGALLAVGTAVIGLTLAIPALVTGLGAALGAFTTMSAFLLANPIGLALAALAIAGTALYAAWKNDFGHIQEIVYGVSAAVTEILTEHMSFLRGFGQVLRGVFTLNPTQIEAGFKLAAENAIINLSKVKAAYDRAYQARKDQQQEQTKREEKDDEEDGKRKEDQDKNAIEDLAKYAQLHEKTQEQLLKDEIDRIEKTDIKEAQSAQEVDDARSRQERIAEQLFHKELDWIEITKGGTLESIALREDAELKLEKLRESLDEKADAKKESLERTAEDATERALEADYKDQIEKIENVTIRRAKSEADVTAGLTKQRALADQLFDAELAHIDATSKSDEEADAKKDKAQEDHEKLIESLDEKAYAKRRDLQKKEEQEQISYIQSVSQSGLKGAADTAVRAVGSAFGGPVLSELVGSLFEKLTSKKDEFRAYVKSLFDASFIQDLIGNLGYAIGKAISVAQFGEFVRGVRDAFVRGIQEAIPEIGQGLQSLATTLAAQFKSKNPFKLGVDTQAAHDDLENLQAQLVTLQQQQQDAQHAILVQGLQNDIQAADQALSQASQNAQTAQQNLNDAITKSNDAFKKQALDDLNTQLDAQTKVYADAQQKVADLQNQLLSLQDQKHQADQTDAKTKADAASADKKFILDRDNQNLTSLKDDFLSTQDDLQNSHDAAEQATLQAHLDDLQGKIATAQGRQQTAQAAYDTANLEAQKKFGVEQAATLDQQIADTKAKLAIAQQQATTDAVAVATTKTKIAATQAVQEEAITGAKVADAQKQLTDALAAEIVARAAAAAATKALADEEANARGGLNDIEKQIADNLERQKKAREDIAAGEKSSSVPEKIATAVAKGVAAEANPLAPGIGTGVPIATGGVAGALSLTSGLYGSAIGKILTPPSQQSGAPTAQDTIKQLLGGDSALQAILSILGVGFDQYSSGLSGGGALPSLDSLLGGDVGSHGEDSQFGGIGSQGAVSRPGGVTGRGGATPAGQAVHLVIRGDDEFGRMIAKQLTRGTALGTGSVRVVNGSED